MARIRSVKPEFWTDRKLARLSRDARLLYISLWNQADEWSRVQGDLRYVKGHCLPYEDDLSIEDVGDLLNELVEGGRVEIYEVDGDPYLFLPKLASHQRLEPTKTPSRLPAPTLTCGSAETADNAGSCADESEKIPEESGTIVVQQVASSKEHVASSKGENLPAPPVPDRFPDFWSVYPRRVGRGQALKAWKTALKKTGADAIIVAATAFAASSRGTDQKFIPHPSSWLNGERWADEPPKLRAVGDDAWYPGKGGSWDV